MFCKVLEKSTTKYKTNCLIMKKHSLTYLLVFILCVFFNNTLSAQDIFSYNLTNLEGENIEISDIKGEDLTILDFWASWCKPCIKSIPKLIELSEKFKDSGVIFIGINEDSPRNSSKVKPFAHSLGITYPVLLDSDQELMNELLVNSLPTLIIINKKGEVVYTHIGYSSGDKVLLEEVINKLLHEKK